MFVCLERERYGKKPWLFSSSEQSEMILGEAKKRSVPLCTTFSWSERFSFARFGVYGLAYLQTNRCEPYAHSVHIVFCIRKISIESFLSTTSRAHWISLIFFLYHFFFIHSANMSDMDSVISGRVKSHIRFLVVIYSVRFCRSNAMRRTSQYGAIFIRPIRFGACDRVNATNLQYLFELQHSA